MEPRQDKDISSSDPLHPSHRVIKLVANPQQHASLASALTRPEPRLSDGFSLLGMLGTGSQHLLPQDLTLSVPAPCPTLEQQYRNHLWSQLHHQQQLLQLQTLMASRPQFNLHQLQTVATSASPEACSFVDQGRRVTTEAVAHATGAAAPPRLVQKADSRPARISACSGTSAGTAAPSPSASQQQPMPQLAGPQRYLAPDSPAEESPRTGDSSPQLDSARSLDSEDLSQRLIIGLTYHRADRAWRAIIRVSGKRVHLGQKRDIDEAARLYDSAAYFMFKGEARLNFPDEVHPTPDADTCTKLRLQARGQPQVQVEQWMSHPLQQQPGAVPYLVPLNPAAPNRSHKRASSSGEEAPYKKHGYTHHPRASPTLKPDRSSAQPAPLLSSLLMLAAVAEQELGSRLSQRASPSPPAPLSQALEPSLQ